MDVSTMITLLGIRFEDAAKKTFPDSVKLKFLNNAQIKLANMLHDAYLTELEATETGLTATGGEYAISSLNSGGNGILRGMEGIQGVTINSGLVCSEYEFKDRKKYEAGLYAGSATNPIYYLHSNKIHITNGSTNPSIDVSYLKNPTSLIYELTADGADSGASTTKFDGASSEGLSTTNDYYNGAVIYHNDQANTAGGNYYIVTDYVGADLEFTVSPAAASNFVDGQSFFLVSNDFDQTNLSGVTCDLNPSLHELIITLAEAEGWAVDGALERRDAAIKAVVNEVTILNQRYQRADGLGTQGRR